MRAQLVEFMDKGKMARDVAVGIIARVADLDGRLANMAARIEKLDATMAATRDSCVTFAVRFHWWSFIGTAAVSLTLFWFGLSQIVMMGWGWRLVSAAPQQQKEMAP
jgi:hypothetical protein